MDATPRRDAGANGAGDLEYRWAQAKGAPSGSGLATPSKKGPAYGRHQRSSSSLEGDGLLVIERFSQPIKTLCHVCKKCSKRNLFVCSFSFFFCSFFGSGFVFVFGCVFDFIFVFCFGIVFFRLSVFAFRFSAMFSSLTVSLGFGFRFCFRLRSRYGVTIFSVISAKQGGPERVGQDREAGSVGLVAVMAIMLGYWSF